MPTLCFRFAVSLQDINIRIFHDIDVNTVSENMATEITKALWDSPFARRAEKKITYSHDACRIFFEPYYFLCRTLPDTRYAGLWLERRAEVALIFLVQEAARHTGLKAGGISKYLV